MVKSWLASKEYLISLFEVIDGGRLLEAFVFPGYGVYSFVEYSDTRQRSSY